MCFPFSQPLPFPPPPRSRYTIKKIGVSGGLPPARLGVEATPQHLRGPPRLARHPPTRAATDFLVRPAVLRLASRTKMVFSQEQVPGGFQGSCSLSGFCARGGGHVSSLSRA